MKSPNTKKSSELKAEVHHELKKVEKTIDQLQRRLTPGQILDDVVFYPHGKSLKSSLKHLRDNPVGTAFLSLGTILLMEDELHQSIEERGREQLSKYKTSARESVNEARDAIRKKFPEEKREDIKEKTIEKIQNIKDAVQGKASLIGQEFRKSVAESENKKSFTTTDRTGKVKERAGEIYQKGKVKLQQMDSLSFLALGAALGAITGSSLPVADQERGMIQQNLGDELSQLRDDLEKAINQSSNTLKDLVIEDLNNYDLRIFKEY